MHPLHVALLHANAGCAQVLLEAGADANFGYDGNPPLHLGLALCQFATYRSDCFDCLKSLLGCDGVDVNAQDRLGRTALHLTVSVDWLEASQLLLSAQINPEARNFAGRLPVHVAVEQNSVACLKLLVEMCGSEILLKPDAAGDSATHVAVRSGAWECLQLILHTPLSTNPLSLTNALGETPEMFATTCGYHSQFTETRDGGEVLPSRKNTLVVTHQLCYEHSALPPALAHSRTAQVHQRNLQAENPSRLEVLQESPNGALLVDEFADNLLWLWTPPPAGIGDVLRVHEFAYVESIRTTCTALEEDQVPFKYDKDTWMTKQSYPAALQAAGAVIAAVDEVVEGRYRNAFCCIRPPGHHLGVYGAVESETDPNISSTGFCLLNNVAIGAAYALAIRRTAISRVAIVDFDVHHGNGTEEIVRNLQPSERLIKISNFQCKATIEISSYKPWLDVNDPQNVLFISSHGFGDKFYPASGGESGPSELYPAGVLNIPFSHGSDSKVFRAAYRTQVFPRLMAFQPDLIFISAGFDGHELDGINHGFLQLDEDDYRWVTEELVKVANACCEGRVSNDYLVSVLEGGYRVKGGIISALAQSVAAHVRGLMNATQEVYRGTPERLLQEEEKRTSQKRKLEEDSNRMVLRKRPRLNYQESSETSVLLQSPDKSEAS